MVGVDGEALDVLGQRLHNGVPDDGREWQRWPPGPRRGRIGRGDCVGGIARETLSGDRFGRVPRRQSGAGHPARELGRVPPQAADTPRARDPAASARLAVDGLLVRVGRGAGDGLGKTSDRVPARALQPGGLGLGGRDRYEKPDLTPAESAVGESVAEEREVAQLRHHTCELLQLAARETQRLPGVIVEPNEPEALVAVAEKEGMDEATEDAAAESLLPSETTEERVEDVRAEVAVEAASLLRGRWIEKFRGN